MWPPPISTFSNSTWNSRSQEIPSARGRNPCGLLRTQLQGGVGTLLDVRQGEQLVYTAAEVIPDDERQIEQTENQISLLLGKNPDPWHEAAF